jgi:ubiquinone/menaquinone biosynthesis C-methylase UbiE
MVKNMETQDLTTMAEAWNNIAAGYDNYVTPTGDWALPNEALRLAGVRPGMRFLDVASGSGALSLPAARIGAEVLAVDISPEMISRLLSRARKEGLPNLEARVMDGHDLELEENRFDISGSQFGVMLFPDLTCGLRELVRVTKPGGRVLMVAYGSPPEVEFLGFFMEAMKTVVPGFTGLPADPPPLPFQVSDPDVLREKMEQVGLKSINIENSTERLEFYSGDEMWNWVVNSNPIPAMLVSNLTPEQKDEVRNELDKLLRQRFVGKPPAVLTAKVNIATGIK